MNRRYCIAVVSDGNNMESCVAQCLESCKYLLIVNMSDLSVNTIKNEVDLSGENLAKNVIDFDCEAIITGVLNQEEFDILADAYITRYFGFGHSVVTALDLMEKNSLRLIKNSDGTDTCEAEHHENFNENNSCDGKHH